MPRPNAPFAFALFELPALLFLVGLLCFCPLGCSVSAGGAQSSTLQQQQAALATGVVPPSFFGMVVKAAASPSAQPGVATGARRLWDSGVSWAAVEPARGSFQWATLDAEVAMARQGGLDLTLTLGMTPTWASSAPGVATAYGNGATAMPAQLADWDSYVSAVATRYQGRIHAYEVWNAPEDTRYWTGDAQTLGQDMATLAAHAARVIHAVDRNTLVVSPALSPAGLTAFLAAGGGSSVDAIGTALGSGSPGSPTASAPEAMTATLAAVRGALSSSSAVGKPIWNDQAGWLLPEDGLSASLQADYLARALVLNAGLGVQRIHWYAWDDHADATLALSTSGLQTTPAGAAYSQVEQWLSGAQLNGCSADARGVWTCQLVRGGATEWIVWSPDGTLLSSAYGATSVSALDGEVSAPDAGGSIEAGPSPVLLQ